MKDYLQSFIINHEEYRGIFVKLDDSYQKIITLHAYPEPIAQLLGEALAAIALLGHNLKQAGRMALQIETEGSLKFLVAEMNNRLGIRGLSQWRDNIPFGSQLLESGKFVITMMPERGERYQGIVPLIRHSLAKSLESYFTQSEQVFTKILLACDGKSAAGLLIQKLPSQLEPSLDKTTLSLILDTVTQEELLFDASKKLLHKLFHEQTVELFQEEPIHFECTCSHEKMENAVRMLGPKEAEEVLSTHKVIEVTCEFCNHRYAFDKNEVNKIFD
ncbi:MAG: Hsp33 protein [Gammaproteobacteria bacterium]|jgi:molecular chaperone Hsp33|nr:Hsp33 protein [Gammaproteobacteria bacterium]